MGTPLTSVSGIGPAAAAVLAQHGFTSAEQLAASVIEELVKVPGFGQARAATTLRAARSLVEGAAQPVPAKGKKAKPAKGGKAKGKARNKDKKKAGKKADQKRKKKDKKKDKKNKGKKRSAGRKERKSRKDGKRKKK